MSENTKRQHYIPQSYLENFQDSSGKISCFDKTVPKKFSTSTRNIGQEKWFYDGRGNQPTEKKLQKLEGKFKPLLSEVTERKDIDFLTDNQKQIFAEFLATQAIRTRERRESMKGTLKQLKKELEDESLSGKMERLFQGIKDEEAQEKTSRRLQKEMIENHTKELKEILLDHDWILLENDTERPFWTSDNPVVMFNSLSSPNRGNLGFASKGIQIYFPLTPELCLAVVDSPSYIGEAASEMPSKYTHQSEKPIKFHNHLQVKWSTRHLYSNEKQFDLAKRALKDEPELANVDRVRVVQPDYKRDRADEMLQNWKHHIRFWRNRR